MRTFAASLMAVALLTSTPAFAQKKDHRITRCAPGDRHCAERFAPVRQPERDRGRDDGMRRNDRWDGPPAAYRRGDRIHPDHRSKQYVVDDWRGHGLRRPPRGYQWVQNGGDYLLVAVTTGIILELLLNR